jgi:hypothetical protein
MFFRIKNNLKKYFKNKLDCENKKKFEKYHFKLN